MTFDELRNNIDTLLHSPDILLVNSMAVHAVLVLVTLLLHIYHEMLTMSSASVIHCCSDSTVAA